MSGLLRVGAGGIACPAGGFEIDPRRPAPLALLTHAHADHARPGSGRYLAAEPSLPLLRRRLGANATLLGVPYGETLRVGGVRVSFHPAGHILGSAQIRVEAAGEVWVATGDFKRQPDPTCAPFEPVLCDVLVTEATFARPVWRWPDPGTVAEGILAWWEEGRAAGRASVLLCYALGKAQRVLAELARLCQRRVFVHPAIDSFLPAYRCTLGDSALLPTRRLDSVARGATFAGELVLAPPSAIDGAWLRSLRAPATALASGWTGEGGAPRRRGVQRGFPLSDHADWPGLLRSVRESGARRVLAVHGQAGELVRALREDGIEAVAF
jgi:putative mRNA 3-end processing factor